MLLHTYVVHINIFDALVMNNSLENVLPSEKIWTFYPKWGIFFSLALSFICKEFPPSILQLHWIMRTPKIFKWIRGKEKKNCKEKKEAKWHGTSVAEAHMPFVHNTQHSMWIRINGVQNEWELLNDKASQGMWERKRKRDWEKNV